MFVILQLEFNERDLQKLQSFLLLYIFDITFDSLVLIVYFKLKDFEIFYSSYKSQ